MKAAILVNGSGSRFILKSVSIRIFVVRCNLSKYVDFEPDFDISDNLILFKNNSNLFAKN